jgi:hypothetical protein
MDENNQIKKPVSAYQQLTTILNALKTEKITLNDAMNKIQLKDSQPIRPYCKVTTSGALALYGITKQPIVLYADQWNKLSKIVKSDYLSNYIKYNENRLKYKNKTYHKNDNNVKNEHNHNIKNDVKIFNKLLERSTI